uniref:PiggyBac transposable element-derived protein domain-containing protein n=1 Tax=Phytophthora ramorum TaxID=164328 RepID=H3GJM0_PHYRM
MSSRRNLSNLFDLADSDSNYEDSERGSNDDETGVVRSSHNEEEETKEGDSQVGGTLTNDPNITTPGDNLADYTALDSDGDGEGDSIYSDDDDLDWATLDADDAAPDLHFDPQLLTAVGGVDAVASGTIRKQVLDDMAVNGWTVPRIQTPWPYMDEPYEVRPDEWLGKDYPGIYDGPNGPTASALQAASTPLGAFLRFVTPQLLAKIGRESDTYFTENLDARVEAQHAKQQARKLKRPDFQVQAPEQIKTKLQKTLKISGRELCCFIGLLIARTFAPNREKFAHHWKNTDEGAIPRGGFGNFMKRDRFDHISRNLHFSSNGDDRAVTDRAWKLRPVIDVLQDTFQRSFTPPPVMAFDEAMLS